MRWYILITICFSCSYCTNADTVTETTSSDTSIKAIDPQGTIGDTSQYLSDSASGDSTGKGLTH